MADSRKWKMPMSVFLKDARYVLKRGEMGMEILRIAFPAALTLAADPIASLIDTAFIGRLDSVQIAAVGVSIAIFNQASKVTIFPLVNITTSFVAQEETLSRLNEKQLNDAALEKDTTKSRDNPTLTDSTTGDEGGSPMLAPARKYLNIRSLGAPAVLLSLAMQAIFRGLRIPQFLFMPLEM